MIGSSDWEATLLVMSALSRCILNVWRILASCRPDDERPQCLSPTVSREDLAFVDAPQPIG